MGEEKMRWLPVARRRRKAQTPFTPHQVPLLRLCMEEKASKDQQEGVGVGVI
jgi:hypothetical protein